MIASLLTAACFAMAGITARQSTKYSGPSRANVGRLLVGILVLGILALFSWGGMPTSAMNQFALAGGIGFGFGGFFMMQTLRRLGTPTALLFVESCAAVFAGGIAWVALKESLSLQQITACAVILLGVIFAGWTWMSEKESSSVGNKTKGYLFGLSTAACQAISLVISRHIFVSAQQNGLLIGKFDAALVRLIGGGLIAGLLFIFLRVQKPTVASEAPFHWIIRNKETIPIVKQPLFWVVLNGLLGPVLGVTCWLWAVSYMHPGIVQSIAAIAPLISLPVARLLEHERLGVQFYLGAPVAILGITLLALS